MGSIDPVSPEEELALNVKVENIVSVTIQLTAALMALQKAVDIISHQPTLILSQRDRTEIGRELAETVDRSGIA
jgi:hypothetical protein